MPGATVISLFGEIVDDSFFACKHRYFLSCLTDVFWGDYVRFYIKFLYISYKVSLFPIYLL